jgi:hypothetical protein
MNHALRFFALAERDTDHEGGWRQEGRGQVRNFHFHCWAFAQLIGMCVVPATLQEYSLALRGRCGITGSFGA